MTETFETDELSGMFRALAQEEEYHRYAYQQRLQAVMLLLDLVDEGSVPQSVAKIRR